MPTPVNRPIFLTATLTLCCMSTGAKLMATPGDYDGSMPYTAYTPAAVLEGYELKFEDNFDALPPGTDVYDTGLNPDYWVTQRPWGPYARVEQENQVYIDQHGRHQGHALNPFSLVSEQTGNNVLKITSRTISDKNIPHQPAATNAEWLLYPGNQRNPDYNVAGGWQPGMASGLISTYDSFNFVNGYVEIRASLPDSRTIAPALRLVSGNAKSSQAEIAISGIQETDTNRFHTYAVKWEPGLVQWYLDGQVIDLQTGDEVSTQAKHLLINLANRNNGSGEETRSEELLIDYVRVYQRVLENKPLPREAGRLFIEAENAILLGSMVAGNDANASSGAFVHVPVGTGSGDACIDFVFDVGEEGLFTIEAGISGQDENQNSFFISIDGGSRFPWTFSVSEGFTTEQVTSRGGRNVTLRLSPGNHTVRIARRENGARIDWMRLVPVSPEDDQDADGFNNAVDVFPLDSSEWIDSDNDGLGNNADPTPYGAAQPLRAEAEVAILSGTMTVQADPSAEGGAYVTSPVSSIATGSDFIQFDFKVPTTANYRIQAGVFANSGQTDSFFVSVNDGPSLNWTILNTGNYVTSIVSDQGDRDLVFLLGTGTNTVKVSRRESGARLDWLQLIPASTAQDTDGDGFEQPADAFPDDPAEWTDSDSDGLGNNEDPTPYGDSTPLRAEAEVATLRGQMRSFDDSRASNGGYVSVPPDSGSTNPREDAVEFDFKVTTAGRYSISASVYATNGSDDSFFISVNGGDLLPWGIPALSEYRTDTVSVPETGDLILDLTAGAHRIQISRRENGARLDWLELVPAPSGNPAESIRRIRKPHGR